MKKHISFEDLRLALSVNNRIECCIIDGCSESVCCKQTCPIWKRLKDVEGEG